MEFLIVVLGVAAALAAENWREAQIDRRTEREYLQRLRSELEDGRYLIFRHQGNLNASQAAIDTLLGLIESPGLESAEDSLRIIVASSNYSFNAAAVILDLTYREMLSTGSLNLVQAPDLRSEISRYYRNTYRAEAVITEAKRRGVDEWLQLVLRATGGEAAGGVEALGGGARNRLRSLLSNRVTVGDRLRGTRAQLVSLSYWMGVLLTSTDELIQMLSNVDP